ncbi:hypothetical protein GE09DRAFT_1051482 [Coniochaeta sp. 2T2.1]|nr:hypothetical protein GE09DRAFT_1051482 [Coniochaeta sp. 2T2.1]
MVLFKFLLPLCLMVKAQGFDPAVVDTSLRTDAANIVKAGYNLRVVLMGPEQNVSVLAAQIQGTTWDGTGIGYGVRGGRSHELTTRLEDIIQLYRDRVPRAPILFDYSPDSALWAVTRKFPRAGSDCAKSPGKDLGFGVFCDVCG